MWKLLAAGVGGDAMDGEGKDGNKPGMGADRSGFTSSCGAVGGGFRAQGAGELEWGMVPNPGGHGGAEG